MVLSVRKGLINFQKRGKKLGAVWEKQRCKSFAKRFNVRKFQDHEQVTFCSKRQRLRLNESTKLYGLLHEPVDAFLEITRLFFEVQFSSTV